MKISKPILLIASVLIILFASGCSKNLFHADGTEPNSRTFGGENVGDGDTGPDFGSAKQGMPEDGSTDAFSAEPFSGDGGKESGGIPAKSEPDSEFLKEGVAGEVDTPSRLYEKPGARSFGSAKQGMPGDGATGSFSADPFSDDYGRDTPSRLYEKPDARKFGSAKQGMPGDGATGSFSADPFSDDYGKESSATGASPDPDAEFFRETNVGEEGTPSRLYEKPDARKFGSAKQGMPGDGATGSFSAEPFSEKSIEPFIEESGVVVQLPKEEEVRRQLPYSSSDRLRDIHFEFDKFDLTDKSIAILKQNAAYLKAHPNSRIEIQGHCDERGSNKYNITLGERRVQSTKSYLVFLGVKESRIHTVSYGEERPFCFESNEKCWYQNRRGHFLVAE